MQRLKHTATLALDYQRREDSLEAQIDQLKKDNARLRKESADHLHKEAHLMEKETAEGIMQQNEKL